MSPTGPDTWDEGSHYDDYMGRWSALMADEFLDWLAVPAGSDWLDVGCGTGALASRILWSQTPRTVSGVDPSPGFVQAATKRLGPGHDVRVGNAEDLPYDTASFDASVSGLALNFVSDPMSALRELHRVTRSGGVAATYLWDYAEGMEMIRIFWDIAIALDPSAADLDEAIRFPLCRPGPLRDTFASAVHRDVEIRQLEIPTVFYGFGDYWGPLLGGQGPIPSYVMGLSEDRRVELRTALEERLPEEDGRIALTARAWGAKALVK